MASIGHQRTTNPQRSPHARRHSIVVSLLLVAALTSLLLTGRQRAQAQSFSINKHLVANPPANPTTNTSFTDVTTPSINTPHTYVIAVDGPGNTSINVTDNFPSAFTVTGCTAYANGTQLTGSFVPPNFSLTTVGNPGNATIYCAGSFTATGSVTNTATVTGGGGSMSDSVTVTVLGTPPAYDLSVEKTADVASVPNGGSVVFYVTVSNNSTVPAPLGATVALFDQISNPTSNEFEIAWDAPSCSGTPCFTMPPAGSATLLPGDSANLFGTTGATTTGSMPPGATMTIKYSVTFDTFDPCATTTPVLKNSAYLANGGLGGNLADAVVSNNTSNTPITITGLPVTCPPLPVKVQKLRVSPADWDPNYVTYSITVANVSSNNVVFKYTDNVRTQTPAPTAFDATVLTATCTSASPGCQTFNPTWIGSAPNTIIQSLPTWTPSVTLTPGQTFTLDYKVKHKATCQIRDVDIINTFMAKGKELSTPPTNFSATATDVAKMPPLKPCELKVTKTMSGVPGNPIQFGTPYGNYVVKWTNTSATTTLRMGSLWDVMHVNDVLYATVPVQIPTPICSHPSGGSGATSWIYTASPAVNANWATPAWQGAKIIYGQNATIAPLQSITCQMVFVKANAPSLTDPKCMSSGNPRLVNVALADPDPAYNPSLTPFKSASVAKRLPWCRHVRIVKTATPTSVLPGGQVTWKITIENLGPTPNLPIGGFTVSDPLPAGLVLSSGPSCTPGCTASFASGTVTVAIPPGSLAVGVGAIKTVTFTTTAPNTVPAPKLNVATASAAGPGFYWHDGAPPTDGAQINTAWPDVTKAFSPATVSAGGLTTLTFTINNLSYKPAVSPLAFTDQLPAGLSYGPGVTSNTCGGTATLSGNTVSLTGGALASGATSCTLTISVRAAGCGTFTNLAAEAVSGGKVDVSALTATLTVTGCNGDSGTGSGATTTTTATPTSVLPTLTKAAVQLPGSSIWNLTFTITNPAGNAAQSGLGFTDTLPAGTATVGNNTCGGTLTGGATVVLSGASVGAGPATCTAQVTVNLGSQCGSFVNNSSNIATSTLNASGASATMTQLCGGGANAIKIVKDILGIPSSGTYVFTVNCNTVTFNVTFTLPSAFSWNSGALPVGTTACVVTETSATASGVSGWGPPTFSVSPSTASMTGTGSTRTVTLAATGVTTVNVINNPSTNTGGAATTTTTAAPSGSQTVTIEKIGRALGTTQSAPIPAGTYSFTVVCGSQTFTASVVHPSPGIWTTPALPAGTTSCTITENTPLPTGVPWAGTPQFFKGSPSSGNQITSSGYTATVTINPTGNTLIIVANQRI